ncbi:MAG: MarC family protein [Candidatus Hydrothermarchaeales archaeon]
MMIDTTFILNSFIALLLIVDPLGNIPIFLSLTGKFERREQVFMIRRAVVVGFLTLAVLTVTGNLIFEALGVKMYSFRIAGGILLFIISIEMLFGRKTRTGSSGEEMEEKRTKEELAVTPMAIPLMAGPGAITAGVVLYNLAPDALHQGILILNVLLVFLVSYILFLKANEIFSLLGKTGTTVIIRIMGLILAAIAVQFIISGIGEAAKALI